MEKEIYKYLSDDDFLLISDAISESEKTHSGEIRVSIKEKRSFIDFRKDIRSIALKEFRRLKMDKTRDKTGVILLILLKEKKFYILADEGINSKVEQNTWDKIAETLRENFIMGNFRDGIIETIKSIGKNLHNHFPIKEDDTNELSNKVEI